MDNTNYAVWRKAGLVIALALGVTTVTAQVKTQEQRSPVGEKLPGG